MLVPRLLLSALGVMLAAPVSAQQFTLAPGALPGPHDRWTEGVECADVDGDGDLDVLLAHGAGWSDGTVIEYPHTLLINRLVEDGAFSLVDESAARLGLASGAKMVVTGDVDGDGWVDVLFANCYDGKPPTLYMNRGAAQPGVFDPAGPARGLVEPLHSYSGAFGDVDGDGDLDLVLGDATTYWDQFLGGEPEHTGRPRLYLNDGAGSFTEAGPPGWDPPVVSGTHDVQMVDLDLDWDVDVVISNVSFGQTHVIMRNDGGGAFTDVGALLPTISASCWETEVADLDGDLDTDLFALALDPGPPGFFWEATNGPVRNQLVESGVLKLRETIGEGATDINECVLVDYDVDGDLDAFVPGLYVPQDQVHRNDGLLEFTLVTGVLPDGPDPQDPTVDATVADLDGDGDLDFLAVQGEAPGADWTNTLYLNGGPADTLAPIVAREELPGPWLPLAGPWVVRAEVRDQVMDDGKDWVSSHVTWRVTDGDGAVHADAAAGVSIASGLDRFELRDTAGGLGATLAYELHFTDRAGNATVTPTRGAGLCGFAPYGLQAGGSNVLPLEAAGSSALGAGFSVTTSGVQGPQVFFLLSFAPAAAPMFGGTVLVDLAQILGEIIIVAPTAGGATIGFGIPVNPGLVGLDVYLQAASQDAGQPQGFAFSHGVKLVVCPQEGP